ncbi:hypothetical protein IFM89_007785 [Coptis chinensis]|uniref:Remorin C-terminal domain-containing protein n=1 Tax=Coptis chinensis TaxID=261450 RepID=A0A835IWS9_9MAGN|nr:hypothetical protein IFM89_007785 [Coptis chinensis]
MKETVEMDYERIEKNSQGGGFSPVKLRNMLLGIDKKRRAEEQQLESTDSLRSQVPATDDQGVSTSENCKDLDIVSELPDCSTSSNVVDNMTSNMSGDRRVVNSRIRAQEDGSLDYDSGYDSASMSSSVFEFHKNDRAPPRAPFKQFSKHAPSKWDDAQKWIASPTSTRNKVGQSQAHGAQPIASRKPPNPGFTRQSSTKIVVEVPEQKSVAFEEPDTKRIDSSQVAKKEGGGQKFVSWLPDEYPIPESYAKPVIFESSIADTAISLSQHDSSISVHSATTYVPPPSTVRSVSMRDMGTEMTPIASQEPSRTGTPVRATTPIRSPTSSRPSTPGKAAPTSTPVDTVDYQVAPNKKELSEKEIQKRTRREIMALGTQLGKMNIAAWASKEDEDKDASTSFNSVDVDQTTKSVIESRAAAWEEAEKAKYTASICVYGGFTVIEHKQLMWVEVERMRGKAHDKLMEKLAAARHKAEEKRAAAEVKRNRQAAKTEQQAEYIRRTGRLPSFSCCNWCF